MTIEAVSGSVRSRSGWELLQFLGGEYLAGEGAPLTVQNPATEEFIASGRCATPAQVDAAAHHARAALTSGGWRDGEVRRKTMLRLAELVEQNEEALTEALVCEIGTPVALCHSFHIPACVTMLRFFAEQAVLDRTRLLGRDPRPPASESMIRYEPTGVVAAIGAYNSPLWMLGAKAGAALSAGCSVVFMSSPQAPITPLLFAGLANEAGFPAGVFNVVLGGTETGIALTTHPQVDKITFTGSVTIGSQVMQQAARSIKGVVLELGGKSAGVVLPSADLAKVVPGLHARYLRNAGQACQAPTRLLIHEDQFDDFVELSRHAFASLKVGDPWDPATVIGPLISEAHRRRVEESVEGALRGGARIVLGGGRPADQERGWFMNATMVGDVANTADIAQHELFGPVSVALTYRSVDEAVEIANDSPLGLAGHIYGEVDEAKLVAERLNAGTITINGGGALRVDGVMRGWKQSGVGSELGEEGIREFLEPKLIQWPV
jgi:aldehyde dehydrogenase (NAD+)